jgi:hypothetical protein
MKKKKSLKKIETNAAESNESSLENKKIIKRNKKSKSFNPEMVAEASANTDMRRNISSTIERTDRFKNIDDGLVPFRNSNAIYGPDKSAVDIRDAVILCQKCYYNFALFRNIIDLMTEFSIDNIYFKGGNKQSRAFFDALFKKINIWDLQDKFYREYYRSGNVFIYRFDAEVKPNDIRKLIQSVAAKKDPYADKRVSPIGDPVLDQNKIMGDPGLDKNNQMGYPTGYPTNKKAPENPLLQQGDVELEIEPMKMPARYIILNPADINMLGTANFSYGIYYKILTEYEVSRLRNLQTEEDIEVFNSLPTFTKDQIRAGVRSVYIPLDTKKVKIVFYKKQDYEPFAVPMGYPVLEDINAKIELRRIDMAISRTMQQIILLVTAGTEPEKGGINQKNLEALKTLFTNQSVGRVLIADYTTKAEFIVPKIAELLDPKKYEIIDKDINVGLNNIFLGGEKFANQQKKIEIFVKRLEQAKQAFLNNFLIPEIKRISKSLNFKSYPTPYYDDTLQKDDPAYTKIYSHLLDIGILTPEQGIEAIQTNRLPEIDELEEGQKRYKNQRDAGLYTPLIGGSKMGEAGRPTGSSAPQTTKKVSPMGSKANEEKPEMQFSLSKLKDNMAYSQKIEQEIISFLKKKHKIKKLSETQLSIASEVLNVIIANEEVENWKNCVEKYCNDPTDKNQERINKILSIAAEHQVDTYMAALLYASKK